MFFLVRDCYKSNPALLLLQRRLDCNANVVRALNLPLHQVDLRATGNRSLDQDRADCNSTLCPRRPPVRRDYDAKICRDRHLLADREDCMRPPAQLFLSRLAVQVMLAVSFHTLLLILEAVNCSLGSEQFFLTSSKRKNHAKSSK